MQSEKGREKEGMHHQTRLDVMAEVKLEVSSCSDLMSMSISSVKREFEISTSLRNTSGRMIVFFLCVDTSSGPKPEQEARMCTLVHWKSGLSSTIICLCYNTSLRLRNQRTGQLKLQVVTKDRIFCSSVEILWHDRRVMNIFPHKFVFLRITVVFCICTVTTDKKLPSQNNL